jgi:hypothetical protein
VDVVNNDRVSLSSPQVVELEILVASDAPFTYQVTLPTPVNGGSRTFSVETGADPLTTDEVAALLETVLFNEQTPYAVSRAGPVIVLVGPLGFTFEAQPGDRLEARVVSVGYSGQDLSTGRQIGTCKVIECRNLSTGRMRQYYTRDRDGVVLYRWDVLLQEENTSNYFEVQADQILTLIESAPF